MAKWIGIACFALGLLGWAAVAIVAFAFPGGHPPLSAYVTVPVMIALLPIHGAGFALGVRGMYADTERRARRLHPVAAVGNALLLILNVSLWIRFLI